MGRCSRSSSGTFSGTRPAAGGTFRSPACPAGGWGTGGTPGSQWPVRTGVPLSPSAHRAEGLARTLRWVPAPGAEDRVSPGPPDGVPGAPSSCRLPLATSGLSPPRTPAREGGVADGTPRTASCRPSMVQHETRPPPPPPGVCLRRGRPTGPFSKMTDSQEARGGSSGATPLPKSPPEAQRGQGLARNPVARGPGPCVQRLPWRQESRSDE